MSSTIAVVDYGMGNLRSVSKALEHVALDDQRVIISSDAQEIADAERVVFPGQGAARACMQHLQDLNLNEVVLQAASEKPFLGICMGMQVLMAHSEENQGGPTISAQARRKRIGDRRSGLRPMRRNRP